MAIANMNDVADAIRNFKKPTSPTDFAPLVERGKAVAKRLGIEEAELDALKLLPLEKHLILVPLLERVADRLENLEGLLPLVANLINRVDGLERFRDHGEK